MQTIGADVLALVVLLLLILATAFFVAAECSLVRVRRTTHCSRVGASKSANATNGAVRRQ